MHTVPTALRLEPHRRPPLLISPLIDLLVISGSGFLAIGSILKFIAVAIAKTERHSFGSARNRNAQVIVVEYTQRFASRVAEVRRLKRHSIYELGF